MWADEKDDDGSAQALAADSEVLLKAAMSEQIVPVKIDTARRARPVKVVNKAGEVVGITTHGKVLGAVARRAAVQTAVAGGARPQQVTCLDCGILRAVPPTGRIPKRCKTCAHEDMRTRTTNRRKDDPGKARTQQRRSSAKWRTTNPEKNSERSQASHAKNPERKREWQRQWRKNNSKKLKSYADARSIRKKAEREAAKSTAATTTTTTPTTDKDT